MRPARTRTLSLCLVTAALATSGLAVTAGCRGCGGASTTAHQPVRKLLGPLGGRATLLVQRKKTHTGYTRIMSPRKVEVTSTPKGVIYRIHERTDPTAWRLSAQLVMDARPDGAWLRAQYGLGGQRVGAQTPRLIFPWPPRPGTPRPVRYDITDGRKASGTVTVLRYGFARQVGGKTYQPCLEVRERLAFDQGGDIDLRSVFCAGFGRVEIESHHRSPDKGLRVFHDRATGLAK